MRIIAGSAGGAKLTVPPGRHLRPTADRVRQALFDMLDGGRFGDPYRGQVVVDAFAGVGGLGLEALSRGAAQAFFLELAIPARRALHRNIRSLGFEARAHVISGDATKLRRVAARPAGLILLDPPYHEALALPCLQALRRHGWIDAGTLMVIEGAADDPAPALSQFRVLEERRHGPARLIFAESA